MDQAITVGALVWFVGGLVALLGIAGFCFAVLWVIAQGFKH